jgi:hypothetical protein
MIRQQRDPAPETVRRPGKLRDFFGFRTSPQEARIREID